MIKRRERWNVKAGVNILMKEGMNERRRELEKQRVGEKVTRGRNW